MSYGLQVYNEKSLKVFDSNELPYIFITGRVRMVKTTIPNTYRWGWAYDITSVFSETLLVILDMVSFSQNNNYDGYNYKIDYQNGRWYAWLMMEDTHGMTEWKAPPAPYIYLVDRAPAKPATGFGIECRNSLNHITLSTESPLVQIVSTHVVTTKAGRDIVWTDVGAIGDNLLLLESSVYESESGYQQLYPGGGSTHVQTGGFVDWKILNGRILVCSASYYDEMGHGTEYDTISEPVRFSMVRQP